MKVVINVKHGGFGLSQKGMEMLRDAGIEMHASGDERLDRLSGVTLYLDDRYDPAFRCDPRLVSVVEQLGEESNGKYAKLKVVEIPDGIEFEIDEYDGWETIYEKHRSWS